MRARSLMTRRKDGAARRRRLIGLVSLLVSAASVLQTGSAAPFDPQCPNQSRAEPSLVGRDAALIVDGKSGQVLYERNADAERHPASLTKMMTLYLLFDALKA